LKLRDSSVTEAVILALLIFSDIRNTVEIFDNNRGNIAKQKTLEITEKLFPTRMVIRRINVTNLKQLIIVFETDR